MQMKTAAAVVLIVAGCESRDERLVSFAERSVESQQRQNEIIGRHSEQVVLESRALAEAAKEVVAADAQARLELISAQREMSQGWQAELSGVNRQRDELERERRTIADQRFRDPMIAAAVQTIGLLLVCLLPLVVAAYALRQLNQPVDDGGQLGDLLMEELATGEPMLLTPPKRPLLITEPTDRPNNEPKDG